MKSFKVLGILLSYPQRDLRPYMQDFMGTLKAEALVSDKDQHNIKNFIEEQNLDDIYTKQERYVETFDRSRNNSLYLFEHVHGESRLRGQAMVDLLAMYEKDGFVINNKELPDYLPLFLEYLSLCSIEKAVNLLGETCDILSLLTKRLKTKKSPYAVLFKTLVDLSNVKPDKVRVQKALDNTVKDPQTFDEIDEIWQEFDAFSQQGKDNCEACPPLQEQPIQHPHYEQNIKES